ncbi:stress protein [Superficieibacter electus]|uniref:Stress protein n=1 Tax=Superficieibacter electus TaxID=2022662 RepID=A0A2P5GUZ0_9ENTR|nr:YsnF/AvaK domain-containing protein [Superficieibacter electus]POP44345.1 stress protein [Superficieibacter electus]POP50363.1 stress protein [Superficieibacter electus]
MAHEKIVTAFEQPQQAAVAKEKLIAEGIPESHIDIISGERLRVEDKEIRHPSFWQRLFGDDVDDDYATEYNKAIQLGGVLLTARVDKDEADRVEALLDSYASDYSSLRGNYDPATGRDYLGEVDSTSAADVGGVRSVDNPVSGVGVGGVSGVAPTGNTPPNVGGVRAVDTDTLSASERTRDWSTSDEITDTDDLSETRDLTREHALSDDVNRETLKLAEEEVDISKRRVSDGKIRLRRYTTEEDVSEDISLTEHHANVFRSAVDEPAYLHDVDWSDKTIEVEESHEVPVVNKTAHIREEVGIDTERTERTETVRDTVRRQEVEVDKSATDKDRFNDDKKF